MRLTLGFLVVLCLMAGCSIAPPKPPQFKGEFRPVNAPAHQGTALSMGQAESLALRAKETGHV
jgi:hypothetical protein